MQSGPRVAVVIPAVDEEEAIGRVLGDLPPLAFRVVVVDNGSRDRTAEVAAAAGALVVSEPRRGYGQACLAGIAAVADADVVAFLDGDYSDHPEQLSDVLAPILRGEADLVIGSRLRGRRAPGAHPWHAVAGTRVCVWLMNRLVGTAATDLGPFRAITMPALRSLEMADRNYGWTVEMQVKAQRRGLRVVEVPVDYRPRIGRSKVSGTVRGSVRAGARILSVIARHASPPRRLVRRPALIASAAVLSACVAAWSVQGDQTGRVASFLGLYGIAFAAYLIALRAAHGLTPAALRAAVAVSVVWRLSLALAPPLVSDDVYRSVWEGRIQSLGGNPYAWSDRPSAPRWEAQRDDVWRGVNHKDYTAVYPPGWLLVARGIAAVSDRPSAFKAFLAACELLALWPLASILRRRGLPRERLLVLAWSPLALVEVAGGGHNEGLALLLLSLGWAALESGRPLASALAIAFGAQVKILPALVAGAWARRYRLQHVLAAAAASALPFLPFADARLEDFSRSAVALSRHWRFNETLFAPLAAALGHEAAVRTGAVLVCALAAACAWHRTDPAASGLAVTAAVLLLAPNVLPWYALWLLPFLVVRDEPAALVFTGTVALAYLVYPAWLAGETWRLAWPWRALEYVPCGLVAALSRWRPAAGGRTAFAR